MPTPFQTVFNDSGSIVSSACVWTYSAGTTTPIATYSNNTGTLNANPIIADANGRFTAYVLAGTNYKFVYENTPCNSGAHGTVLRTADNILGTPGASATVDVTGTAGETLSAGNCAYLSDGSGGKNAAQWYKCDATNTYSSTTPAIGIALAAITAASSGSIRIQGSVTGLSALSGGTKYYASTTAGALTSTAPTNSRFVGQADSATTLVLIGNPPPFATLPLSVANGGTALATTPTNGQLLIGNGTNYTLATLTAGNGIAVTNGAGSITITDKSYVLDKSTTEQDVTNTTTETSVYSYSVPGGTLSTANAIHLKVTGLIHTDTTTDSLNVRVKYGGTTIAATGAVSYTAATNGAFSLDVWINANGATNSQRVAATFWVIAPGVNATDGTFGNGATNSFIDAYSSLAVDSTASQTLQVTFQWSAALSTDHAKRWLAVAELIQ